MDVYIPIGLKKAGVDPLIDHKSTFNQNNPNHSMFSTKALKIKEVKDIKPPWAITRRRLRMKGQQPGKHKVTSKP